ncbi:MAG: homoserine kinase, partial [Elusimicrobiota bacterium]
FASGDLGRKSQSGTQKFLKINVSGEGEMLLKDNSRNVLRKTFTETLKEFRLEKKMQGRFSSIDLNLISRIPLMRGLGFSATARVGVICAINNLADRAISDGDILAFASRLEGHPDNAVPAFSGGLCIAVQDSGKVDFLKLKVPSDLKAVLCVPDFGLATELARKVLPERIDFRRAVFNSSRTALLVASILNRNYKTLRIAMEDALHQPYRKRFIPGFDGVISAALERGAFGAALSGSGSTILAICPDDDRVCERVGKAMVDRFFSKRIGSRYIVCGFDNEGIRVKG